MTLNNINILATLGPSSFDSKVISQLEYVGVDIFRINLSHTSLNELKSLIELVHSSTTKPLCIDTEGAQIRTGNIRNGSVVVRHQEIITIVCNSKSPVDHNVIPLRPSCIASQIREGDLLSMDFTSVLLHIITVQRYLIKAKVVSGGLIRSNKAVSLDRAINLPALSDKDLKAIAVSKDMGVKHFALSFASCNEDVIRMRNLTGNGSFVIAKIESRLGLSDFNNILQVSDALVVDRGDLSREIPIEKIPFLQKDLIKRANQQKKPIYVATNLLESMVNDKQPSRAEVNDVINTLIDGADGLVLAAETAIGKHPVNSANMIASLIKEYTHNAQNPERLVDDEPLSSLLVEPHGGKLIDRYVPFSHDIAAKVNKLPHIMTDEYVYLDTDQIAMGTYSPLIGFMNRDEIHSVLNRNQLPTGEVWTLPIVFQTETSIMSRFSDGDEVVLVRETTNKPYAILCINDIYVFDVSLVVKKWFQTDNISHPGVKRLQENGDCFVGGEIFFIRDEIEKDQYLLTPRQTRMIFEHKGWISVLAFHTRNVPHRAHECVLKNSLERTLCNGVFVQPVIGPKKKGDFAADVVLEAYNMLIEKYFDSQIVVLGAFSTYSRYSGPREAVFTALCRQNYGCSHFIVGRDHTGVGNFYKEDASQKIFESLQDDIKIKPVFSDEVYYCSRCNDLITDCEHGERFAERVSGSKMRQCLAEAKPLPDWFIRKEVFDYLLTLQKKGSSIYV
jgi:pyruvate kinase